MNGVHDLGGMMGFGAINPETDEPVFHADWEKRVLAATLAMGALGKWNIDMGRHARERVPGPLYLNSSYYQIWLEGLITLLIEQGFATRQEIADGVSKQAPLAGVRALKAQDVAKIIALGGPATRDIAAQAKFEPGQKVKTKNLHPIGHTRLARYLRGHIGEIVRDHGTYVLPDSNAHGGGEDPHWLYGVRFMAQELWGEDANPYDSVCADLWECYLDPA